MLLMFPVAEHELFSNPSRPDLKIDICTKFENKQIINYLIIIYSTNLSNFTHQAHFPHLCVFLHIWHPAAAATNKTTIKVCFYE